MKLITSTQDLQEAVDALAKSDFVAVDTEFIRETTFWPELCLIQMATPDHTALVDALAPDLDLKPFFELMANPNIVKVFHAARQDVEIVHHLGGLIPEPLFDTQVAAMVCGFGDAVSYDQLVQKVASVQIDKSSRFTDWRRRPLSEKQLDYALSDVTYLRDVYNYLKQELEKSGRSDWVQEEMHVLRTPETYDLPPENAWKKVKFRVRKPLELAILQSVATWREREARARNVPRGRIIKDDTIGEIAQQQPKDVEALGRLRSIPKGWEKSAQGQSLLEAVNNALAIPKEDLPTIPKHSSSSSGNNAASEVLKLLLKVISEKQGVAPKIIAHTDEIEKIAALGENANVAALQGWRREVFGQQALDLLEGRTCIKFESKRIVTRPVKD